MIVFLLNLYIFVVWLIYGKLKLMKFDTMNRIIVGVLGVLFVFGLLIVVNFAHPMTLDARVIQHVVQIAPRITQPGRVIEVPVAPNEPLKQGATLFKIDPRPYEYEVSRLTAVLTATEQSVPQLKAALTAADAAVDRIEAERKLAQLTLDRDLEIRRQNAAAITAQKLDEDRAKVAAQEAALREAQAQVESAQVAISLSSQSIAEAKAQLSTAKLNLEETNVVAPADGYVTMLELRPGFIIAPGQTVMSFVCDPEGIVAATLAQEYSARVKAGDEVELCLDVYPGKTLHGKLVSVIEATGQGQLDVTGKLVTTGQKDPIARIPLKIAISDEDRQRYPLPAGASGAAAIYTDRLASFRIVRRVMIRWYTWLNFIKLSL